jgi:hypothetical protein
MKENRIPNTLIDLYSHKRGMEHCAHTLKRISDLDKAIFDEQLWVIFESKEAQNMYYEETRKYLGPKFYKKNRPKIIKQSAIH